MKVSPLNLDNVSAEPVEYKYNINCFGGKNITRGYKFEVNIIFFSKVM